MKFFVEKQYLGHELLINASYFSFPGVGGSWLDPLHLGRFSARAAGRGQPKHNHKGQYGRDEGREGGTQAQETHQLTPWQHMGGLRGHLKSRESINEPPISPRLKKSSQSVNYFGREGHSCISRTGNRSASPDIDLIYSSKCFLLSWVSICISYCFSS